MLPDIPKGKQLIVFDGVCNLCNSSVQFIIKYDVKEHFLFTPIKGKTGEKIFNHFKGQIKSVDSIFLYTTEKKIYYGSKAVLLIASKLKFPIRLLVIFLIIPSFITNFIYNYIARNRYKWFGKRKYCYAPTEELMSKFLN